MEIICAMVYQFTRDLTIEDAKAGGFDAYYVDHTKGLWPQAAAGIPFNTCEFQSKGDAIANLTENLAAEQKARVVYDNLLCMITEPEVREPVKFLRTRKISIILPRSLTNNLSVRDRIEKNMKHTGHVRIIRDMPCCIKRILQTSHEK